MFMTWNFLWHPWKPFFFCKWRYRCRHSYDTSSKWVSTLNMTCAIYNKLLYHYVGCIIICLFICRIPRNAFHVVPTTFLLSIEGMPGLDWERLCNLQCPDGSFMSSPAPTAYALMQTGDPKCFEFLDRVVSKFNGSSMKIEE
jgi:hypothetical protein